MLTPTHMHFLLHSNYACKYAVRPRPEGTSEGKLPPSLKEKRMLNLLIHSISLVKMRIHVLSAPAHLLEIYIFLFFLLIYPLSVFVFFFLWGSVHISNCGIYVLCPWLWMVQLNVVRPTVIFPNLKINTQISCHGIFKVTTSTHFAKRIPSNLYM